MSIGPIENLDHRFFSFGWVKMEQKNFVSIFKSGSLRKHDPISLMSCIGRRELHLFVKTVTLLFLKYLAEILIQAEKGHLVNIVTSNRNLLRYFNGASASVVAKFVLETSSNLKIAVFISLNMAKVFKIKLPKLCEISSIK